MDRRDFLKTSLGTFLVAAFARGASAIPVRRRPKTVEDAPYTWGASADLSNRADGPFSSSGEVSLPPATPERREAYRQDWAGVTWAGSLMVNADGIIVPMKDYSHFSSTRLGQPQGPYGAAIVRRARAAEEHRYG